ncbi:MAG: hypothetical protein C0592_07850 [Marinilabiliales bacterium]|mgnify:CR=1 FL=1|nr:MAG: hypothetical protein C0592_07850 [Marinilabiliales bacterium]
MKILILLFLLIIALLDCTQQKSKLNDKETINIDGFWQLSYSKYEGEKTSEQFGCPLFDAPIEWIYQPHALGTHILIKSDSISIFRYPYEYYGTYKYELSRDSLFIHSNYTSTYAFSMQQSHQDTIVLNFEEEFTSTCILSAISKYERSSYNTNIIDKLVRDSISCDSLIGKWWYLRKEISYEDGADPTILNFPAGMPDSLFITENKIKREGLKHYVVFEFESTIVRMIISSPAENSFILRPEDPKYKILFSSFYDYGEYGGVDTVYYDVVFQKSNPYPYGY